MNPIGGCKIIYLHHETTPLTVDFAPSRYNRSAHPERNLESSIDQTWRDLTRKNATLFNATKFRYGGISQTRTAATLNLGLTDYKTFLGTHHASDSLRTFGERHMAQPIGNVVIVRTRDDHTALIIRSATSAECAGSIALPGGHPEPSAISPPPVEGDHAPVLRELWHGARREVLEELFVRDDQVDSVDHMRFLALVARASDRKTCMVFSARVDLDSGSLLQQYRAGNVGKEESERLILKPIAELASIVDGDLVDGMFVPVPELTGAAQVWGKVCGASA